MMEKLISAMLLTCMGRGIERSQDYADVVKLTRVNSLPRGFGVDLEVRDEYHKIWDDFTNCGSPIACLCYGLVAVQ